MKERINELIRAYILPTAVIGVTFVPLGVIVPHAIRVNFTAPAEHRVIAEHNIIKTEMSPLPKEGFDFLGPYSCQMVQYRFSDDVEDQLKGDLEEKSKTFFDTLRLREYFPSSDAVQRLAAINAGRGYDLGVVEGTDQWILTYRTSDSPNPFRSGFTLIEQGTNQSVKERFGKNYSPNPGEMNYFMMSPEGLIEYVITLDPGSEKNCIVLKPQQLMFRTWLQGRPWEDLVFAQTQKSLAGKLEEIAKDPNNHLLRRVN